MTPPTAADLALMQGAPPPPDRRVTPDNWIDGPYNRWGFLHVRELARTARISRGDGPVRALPVDLLDLDRVPVTFEGETLSFAAALAEGCTDAICIVHEGRIVFEDYVDGMRAADTHLLMSVSKSLTATLAGVLVGDGVLDPEADVTEYIAALRGTAWEGCTVQHLLDMRAGTRFDEEDYLDPNSDGILLEEVCGYRPRRRTDLPAANTYDWIVKLENARPHGGPFEYRSILTDVLAWCAVAATGTRFPDLFAERVWSRIGAAHDADIIVDEAGFAIVEGGICTTVRDLARFGLMHLEDGAVGDEQVVPAAWIARLLEPDEDLIAVFDNDLLDHQARPFYHDKWWVWDAAAGVYSGYGINGQQLLIHRPTRTVIARFSTWPERWDDRLSRLADVANRAVLERLAGVQRH
jgi:CubicO group peptidase (beta-lactamase class C family)